jgi:hypothetical protein
MFSHSINYIRKYQKCIFNAISKDNAAINCITVQHKRKSSFPSTLTGRNNNKYLSTEVRLSGGGGEFKKI